MNQLSKIQEGWLAFAQKSQTVRENLQAKELKLQALCQTDSKDYNTIDGIIATYDKELKVLIAERMQFTKMIETNLIEPAMAFEKRAKDYQGYTRLKEASLQLRKAAESEAKTTKAIEQEKADFRTHVMNEWKRIETDYVLSLSNETNAMYAECLNAKIKEPKLHMLFNRMDELAKPAPAKFTPQHLSREQMTEIYSSIAKIDFAARLQESKDNAKALFDNHYQAALANSEAAIEQMKKDAAAKEAKIKHDAEKAMAVNTLVAKAEVSMATIEAPKIKRELQPVIVENTQWALNVMMQFVRLESDLWKHVRVKSFANLSIEQMAKALAKHHSDTGEVIDGLSFREIEK
jgi:hypothetical protein